MKRYILILGLLFSLCGNVFADSLGTKKPIYTTLSGGVNNLLGLTDTPSSFDDGKYLKSHTSSATWVAGAVTGSGTFWWSSDGTAPEEPFVDGDMNATITNTGSVVEDIDVKVAAFTGGDGWTISTDDTPIEGEISIRAGTTGTANEAAMIQVITTDTELVADLASSGTKKWCMEMETPATFTDGAEKTGVVTLTATDGT